MAVDRNAINVGFGAMAIPTTLASSAAQIQSSSASDMGHPDLDLRLFIPV